MTTRSGTDALLPRSATLQSMVEIVPAILPKSFEGLTHGLARLSGVAPLIQIDLVEVNVLAEQETIPMWEEFDFEADIMLPDPQQEVRHCIDLGFSKIVVHAEALGAKEALTMLQETREGTFATMVGVALQSADSPEALTEFDGLFDYVQVMGIERIGSQGQPFDQRSITLIKELRAKFPELVIQVDGAVAPHVRELVAAGANRLVIGSAIMQAENPREVYKALYLEANR